MLPRRRDANIFLIKLFSFGPQDIYSVTQPELVRGSVKVNYSDLQCAYLRWPGSQSKCINLRRSADKLQLAGADRMGSEPLV